MTSLSVAVTSVAGACAEVRRIVSQNLNDELTFTSAPYTPGDSTIDLKAIPRRCGPGSLLSWHEATFYVVSVSQSSSQVEVIAGYDGGPDVAVPAGAAMRVNPRFTDYTLFRSVGDMISAMSAPTNGIYGVVTETTTGMHTDDFYPIPSTYADRVVKVLSVTERSDGSRDWTRVSDFRFDATPGNQHLRIFTDALQYKIVYGVRITRPVSFLDDMIFDCGMTETMLDIPALGAAGTLMAGQEARRVNQRAQGDPRRAEDVPITGATNSARDLRRLYQQRIDEEYIRQAALYPTLAV